MTTTPAGPGRARPGSGPHWLPLRAALCATMGKREAGTEVDVHLRQRLT